MVILKIFALIIFPFLMFFASAGVNTYIVCRDLNKVLDNFRESIIVSSYGDIWRDGSFLTRFTLSYIVMGSVIFSGKHIRSGMFNPKNLLACQVYKVAHEVACWLFGGCVFMGYFSRCRDGSFEDSLKLSYFLSWV
ncbi:MULTISPECIES: hypothetical protein [unclassified Pseudomonas]|uniref:hypothetical protein n=1 Tax=unclassified Pseudomonas TaxID=196821 RepID=UPI0030DBAEBE